MMIDQQRPSAPSRWTPRIALFAIMLALSAWVLHRLLGMPTPMALNMAALAFVLAAFALGLAVVGSIRIWRRGEPGTARIVAGSLLALGLIGSPLLALPQVAAHPPINDLTTDPVKPPQFETLARLREPSANPAIYPGERFAAIQAKTYPDLRPLVVPRTSEETFELVADAVKRLRMEVVREERPADDGRTPGMIEAIDRTLIAGFYDDVAIRIAAAENGARVDIRSASRYGRYDLGRNAERMRTLMREIVARLEATVPTAATDKTPTVKRPNAQPPLTREKEKRRKDASRRSERDRAQ